MLTRFHLAWCPLSLGLSRLRSMGTLDLGLAWAECALPEVWPKEFQEAFRVQDLEILDRSLPPQFLHVKCDDSAAPDTEQMQSRGEPGASCGLRECP
jgi:hypothetical protein